jgi:hypothetical protein
MGVSRLVRIVAAALAGAVLMAGAAQAHHSFAVFFNADKDVVPITGAVTEFHFTNPHGIIKLTVPGKGGPTQEWKVETNSPSILLRRGWTKDSLKLGETVTIMGWPSRDGTNYMRLRNALRADGTPIGTPLQ